VAHELHESEKRVDAATRPDEPFESVILRSWSGDLSHADVQLYAETALKQSLEMAPRLAPHWSEMHRLASLPVEDFIPYAKANGMPLSGLRGYALQQLAGAGNIGDTLIGPTEKSYWMNIIELIDAR
jgi:hypothetical protein